MLVFVDNFSLELNFWEIFYADLTGIVRRKLKLHKNLTEKYKYQKKLIIFVLFLMDKK